MLPAWVRPLQKIGYTEVGGVSRGSPIPVVATLASAGFSRVTHESYDWDGIKRGTSEFVLFQHTLAGEGRLTFEGTTHVVHPGQTMLLSFPHANRYWLPKQGTWEFFYLVLRGAEILRLWDIAIDRAGPLVRFEESGPSLLNAATLCERALSGKIRSPLEASALAYALAMDVVSSTFDLDRDSPPFVRKVLAYCRRRLSDAIGVEEMAQAAGVSRSQLSRDFRHKLGVSPARYLTELRLDVALELVRKGELSIKEVADRVGFASPNYFGKVFTRRFGVAPGALRDSGMYSHRRP